MNTKSEKVSDISLKVVNICKELKLQTALESIRYNLNDQLDYVLIRDDISSQKYSGGTFKNLYSEHKSLFLRIYTDDNDVFKTANIEENTENRPNTENTTNTQFPEVSKGFFDNQESSVIDDFVQPSPVIFSEKDTSTESIDIVESIDSRESHERAIIPINQLIAHITRFQNINAENDC